jgi:N-methylhydantoinase A
MTYRIGVDIGGTFTDCVAIDDRTGMVRTTKVPTTPADQSEGFLHAVEEVGVPTDEISLLLHGCTVGLNAVLTRTGARTGVLTTQGFRDVLAMGRGQRPSSDQFNPRWRRAFGDGAEPFSLRYLRRTIAGRIDSSGTEVTPLDEEAIAREPRFLVEQGVDAIAICFVNAYANDAHERRAAEIVAEVAPKLYCWTSTGVHPCFKEYPRFSTAIVNTYVGPQLDAYLDRAENRLADRGYGGALMMMQSNGGVVPAEMARRRPAYTLQSGPTGGVIAAQHGGRELGLERLLTLDIGGTSADYSIVDEGEIVLTTELELEHDVIVALPAVNVHSIGSGGGSIAWIDQLGAPRVGPRSAGAVPGPACYAKGGTEPTVTDALAVLGILTPGQFLDGALPFDPGAAHSAIDPLARGLGLPHERAAEAILDVTVADMVEAAREVSVYNGVDPRRFALYVYGSGGPVFGSRIGRELGSNSVVVPPHPGELSAYGLALADLRLDLGRPFVQPLSLIEPEQLARAYADMAAEARRILGTDEIVVQRWLDGRYQGQTWETPSVPVPYCDVDTYDLKLVFGILYAF